MEHHSNFVPWQVLAGEVGATFKVVDINDRRVFRNNWNGIITKKTKILALTYVSNVLGTINPIKEIIKAVKKLIRKLLLLLMQPRQFLI